MTPIDVGGLLEAARSGRDIDAFHRAVFEEFDRRMGFDVATIVHGEKPAATALGFVPGWRETLCARYSVYEAELSRFTADSLAAGAVGVESDYYGSSYLSKTAYYDEIMRPERGRATLYGWFVFGGEPIGTIALGRRRRGFTDRERSTLRSVLPALSICDVALRSRPAEPTRCALALLTKREREIVDYLRLGYTNAQIALAFGTSANTVRNQLVKIYAKLEVSTRAEVVARSVEGTSGDDFAERCFAAASAKDVGWSQQGRPARR